MESVKAYFLRLGFTVASGNGDLLVDVKEVFNQFPVTGVEKLVHMRVSFGSYFTF